MDNGRVEVGELFVVQADGTLKVINVTVPSAPSFVAVEWEWEEQGSSIEASGDLVFVGGVDNGQGRVRVIDVSEPSIPVRRGAFRAERNVLALTIAGDKLYQAVSDRGLQVALGPCTPTDVPEIGLMVAWLRGGGPNLAGRPNPGRPWRLACGGGRRREDA
jgi:hypothetical protein